jgi:hypothetical protein
MATYADYRAAAALLWGHAGEWAADEFARLNREHFAGSVPPLPIVIGLTGYGKCLGLTRGEHAGHWTAGPPRITLQSQAVNDGGTLAVSDVLVHEMAHAALMLRGEDHKHNAAPWCALITELSPGVLGREVTAAPWLPRRVPNPDRAADPSAPATVVARQAAAGALPRSALATWPGSLRPAGYAAAGKPLSVPTY